MRLEPGSVFAGYTIERQLGAGGMGLVYLAQHPRLENRQVALKVLNESFSRDPEVRARFEREAALAARLDHPNVVTVYDRSGPDDPVLWIAMKYVSGGDVAGRIADRGGRIPPVEAARLIAGAAHGLDVAHQQGVLHRDIKPANILIDQSGGAEKAVITDFGIATTVGATATVSGLLASFGYTAPERFRGEPAGPAADVYSLGCTLFEMLTGQQPFARAEQTAVITAHLSAAPPRISDLNPALPAGLNAVIAIALAKAPADRYPTCGALADDVVRMLTGQGEPTLLGNAGQRWAPQPAHSRVAAHQWPGYPPGQHNPWQQAPRPQPRSNIGLVLALLLAGVLVVSAGIFVAYRNIGDSGSDGSAVESTTAEYESTTDSPTTTAYTPPPTTRPPAPVNSGSCIDVNASGTSMSVSTCKQGATYFVTQVGFEPFACSRTTDTWLVEDGYRVCLSIDLSRTYCYNIPQGSGWVTRVKCHTPGSSWVVDILNIASNCSQSSYRNNWSWTFSSRPDSRYCVVKE